MRRIASVFTVIAVQVAGATAFAEPLTPPNGTPAQSAQVGQPGQTPIPSNGPNSQSAQSGQFGQSGQTANEDAVTRFRRGLDLYEEQDFAGALVEFRRAYELSPNYKVLYNIGQVCYQLTDYACALRSFEQYVTDGGANIASERRAQVDKDISKLQTRVGRIEIVTNVPGVDITIDDVSIGRTPLPSSVLVSAGKRRIGASKAGRPPVVRIVDLSGTDSLRVKLDLAEPAQDQHAGSGPVAPAQTPSKWTTLSWVGVGGAAALAVTGGVLGFASLKASDDLKTERFAGTNPPSDIDSKQDKIKTLALASDIFMGAAVVTLTTTLIATFARTPRAEQAKANVQVGFSGTGIALRGGF